MGRGKQKNNETPLTDKQQAFINEYFLCGFNATRAAEKADYAEPNKQGSRLLVNVGIRKEIERRFAEHAMTANEAIARLASMARGDSDDLLDEFGDISIHKLRERGKTHLVKKIKKTKKTYPGKDEDDLYVEERIEVELYDAQAALNTIIKELRLDDGRPTERVALVNDLTDEELERIARGSR